MGAAALKVLAMAGASSAPHALVEEREAGKQKRRKQRGQQLQRSSSCPAEADGTAPSAGAPPLLPPADAPPRSLKAVPFATAKVGDTVKTPAGEEGRLIQIETRGATSFGVVQVDAEFKVFNLALL